MSEVPPSQEPPEAVRPDPDAALMERAAAGDEAAFTELVRHHQHGLMNFFTRMGVHTHAEDLVQETFLRLYRFRERYRPTARFTTYLYVLARHVWADHGRRLQRRRRLEDGLEAEWADRAGVPPDRGRRLDVQEALNRLTPRLREVLVLNVYQGLRYQEMAEVLEIPLGTVKSRMFVALEEMRKLLS